LNSIAATARPGGICLFVNRSVEPLADDYSEHRQLPEGLWRGDRRLRTEELNFESDAGEIETSAVWLMTETE